MVRLHRTVQRVHALSVTETFPSWGGTGSIERKGTHYAGVQFHPESVLTLNGPAIITYLLRHLTHPGPHATSPGPGQTGPPHVAQPTYDGLRRSG
ncbi:glutamine amidotransferase-related protein [Streptomyces uncialis]|uniref:glutamine amidotransferase-related protein n=1 Tax=Streptomyces uncialis TaxID=1048205 RepID=UPI00386FC0EA|nr:hypothetical protein OG924_29120 [Streptomyces uncialis]